MAPPGFISDEQMAAIEAQQAPGFISDEQMLKLESVTGGQQFAGGIANMVPFNLGDEAMAGIRSLVDVAQGENIGDAYGRNLDQIRTFQKSYELSNPKLNIATTLAGNAPVMVATPTALGKVASIPAKMGVAALEGAGTGFLYGAGGGQGAEDRLRQGGLTAALSGVLSPLAVGAAEGGRRLLSKASDDFLFSGLNVQRSDLQKQAKFVKAGEESPLQEAIKGGREAGLFRNFEDASAAVQRNEDVIETIGSEVSSILKAADEVQTDIAIPTFSKARAFVERNAFEKEQLGAQLSKRLDTINQEWDGTISGLNDLKQRLYKIAYKNTTDSRGLDRAIASDMKEFIENQAGSLLGKDAAQSIRTLNAAQGQHLTLRDLLAKNKRLEEMPGGIAKALRRLVVSPIGGAAALGGIGYLSDDPKYGALGLVGALAATRGGQFALSDLARAGAATLGRSAGMLPAATAALANQTVGRTPTQKINTESRSASDSTKIPGSTGAQKAQSLEKKVGQTFSNPPSIFSKNQSIFQKTSSGVPDDILDALKQQESGGDPSAVGPKTKYGTAKGAYQMLDETGKEYHKKLGIKEPYDPHNEKQQRRLAKAYIDDLLEMFDGDLGLALTAYHTGPGNVKKGKIGPIGQNYARSIFEKVA